MILICKILDNFQEGNNTKMEGDDSSLVDEILVS